MLITKQGLKLIIYFKCFLARGIPKNQSQQHNKVKSRKREDLKEEIKQDSCLGSFYKIVDALGSKWILFLFKYLKSSNFLNRLYSFIK